MTHRILIILLLIWCATPLSFAQNLPNSSQEALDWLKKIAAAPRQHNYTGTFIYYTDGHMETSHITHFIDQNGEHERIEVLDGIPRIVFRNNDEMKCYLPESKKIVTEKRWLRKTFPDLFPRLYTNLNNDYFVRLGEQERIAGYECQVVLLEPRDNLRFGHKFWVDTNTGLLLKAAITDVDKIIEQFAFAQIEIDNTINKKSFAPNFSIAAAEWQTTNLMTTILEDNELEWKVINPPTGFSKIIEMKRILSERSALIDHIVLTDGLATVSVFIEPILEDTFLPPDSEFYSSQGAINIYVRTVANNKVTTVGEVPLETIQIIGDSVFKQNIDTVTKTLTQ